MLHNEKLYCKCNFQTSSAVCTLLYYLAKNQDKQDILRKELREAIPEPKGQITNDILRHLPYLRACIKESLRMVPVVPGNLRVNPKDMVLAGYRIPSDVSTIINHFKNAMSNKHFFQIGISK